MDAKLIYLAGPINGTMAHDSQGWRDRANRDLQQMAGGFVQGIDPLRAEMPNIVGGYRLTKDTLNGWQAHAAAAKNAFDVRRSDAILAFLPARENGLVSLGTVAEIGFAAAIGKPVFLVSDDPWVLGNAVLRAWCPWVIEGTDPSAALWPIIQLLAVQCDRRPPDQTNAPSPTPFRPKAAA